MWIIKKHNEPIFLTPESIQFFSVSTSPPLCEGNDLTSTTCTRQIGQHSTKKPIGFSIVMSVPHHILSPKCTDLSLMFIHFFFHELIEHLQNPPGK